MSKLAAEHQSVNLGQGFPDDEGPETMKQVRAAYIRLAGDLHRPFLLKTQPAFLVVRAEAMKEVGEALIGRS
jgi:hypothetical protein